MLIISYLWYVVVSILVQIMMSCLWLALVTLHFRVILQHRGRVLYRAIFLQCSSKCICHVCGMLVYLNACLPVLDRQRCFCAKLTVCEANSEGLDRNSVHFEPDVCVIL